LLPEIQLALRFLQKRNYLLHGNIIMRTFLRRLFKDYIYAEVRM